MPRSISNGAAKVWQPPNHHTTSLPLSQSILIMVNVAAVLVTNWNLFPGLFDGCAFLQQIRNMYEQNRYSIFERNIPLISLSSISAFENLDASHSSHGTSHSLKPTPIGYVGNLTNSAPSTEAIPDACSRNWLRPSPWSNVGLAKIPKAFPAVRQGSFSGWRRSWQTRKFSTNWEYSNPKPDWSWKETGLARPYPFIPKTCPPFIIGVSIDTYFAHCSAGR